MKKLITSFQVPLKTIQRLLELFFYISKNKRYSRIKIMWKPDIHEWMKEKNEKEGMKRREF